jgi:hypothetical protein
MRKMLFLTSVLMLIAACTTSQPEPTSSPSPLTDTPTPFICEDGFLCLTYDGESCTYVGPTTLKAGPAVLIFFNDSEELGAVSLGRHLGDQTIQDAIDYLGEEPSLILPPVWSTGVVPWELTGSGKSYRWEGELKPGLHHMICAGSKQGRWFGTGLTVEE